MSEPTTVDGITVADAPASDADLTAAWDAAKDDGAEPGQPSPVIEKATKEAESNDDAPPPEGTPDANAVPAAKTAAQEAEEFAKAKLPTPATPSAQVQPPVPPAAEPTRQAAPPSASPDGFDFKAFIDANKDVKLGEGPDAIGLADFARDYPEAAQASAKIAEAMIGPAVQKAVSDAVEKALGQRVAPIEQAIQQRQTAELREGILETLSSEKYGHKDARNVFSDEKFWGWVDQQPDWLRNMADSTDPEALHHALNVYKEKNGIAPSKTRAQSVADKQTADRKRETDLHAHTARSVRDGGGGKPLSEEGELKAAWDEANVDD
jgi:hypothetical protein